MGTHESRGSEITYALVCALLRWISITVSEWDTSPARASLPVARKLIAPPASSLTFGLLVAAALNAPTRWMLWSRWFSRRQAANASPPAASRTATRQAATILGQRRRRRRGGRSPAETGCRRRPRGPDRPAAPGRSESPSESGSLNQSRAGERSSDSPGWRGASGGVPRRLG